MPSPRIILLVLFVACAAWLWKSGQWRDIAMHVPVLARQLGVAGSATTPGSDPSAPAAEGLPQPTFDKAAQTPESTVYTWTDEHGGIHYANTGPLPKDARQHEYGRTATLADYEAALEKQEGIKPIHVVLAKKAREQAALARESGQPLPPPPEEELADNARQDAASQAESAIQKQQKALKKFDDLQRARQAGIP